MKRMMKTIAIVTTKANTMEAMGRVRDLATVMTILRTRTRSMMMSTTSGPSLARARVVKAAGTANPAN